jgi:hypothetical protein
MNEQEKILAIHQRLEETQDLSWTELALATALEYGRDVRNQTLEDAAKKVKALSAGLDCHECDSCTARRNDVETILAMRSAEPSNDRS